jgi:hypothetical protein
MSLLSKVLTHAELDDCGNQLEWQWLVEGELNRAVVVVTPVGHGFTLSPGSTPRK